MGQITVVDGGWGGHRLAMTSQLVRGLEERGHRATAIISASAAASREGGVHLTELSVASVIPQQQTGELWWARALEAVPSDTTRVVLPKCDNLLGYGPLINLLSAASWETSALLLKVAPGQESYLPLPQRDVRAARLQRALDAARTGVLDRLSLLCGYGDTGGPDASTFGCENVEWVQDVPLVPRVSGRGRPATRRYALVAGELSWRKKVPDLLAMWGAVFAATGISLALVGHVHETLVDLAKRVAADLGDGVIVRDGYVSNEDLAWWHANADVVLATFDEGEYAASGAVATAQNLGIPIISYGNAYVDHLLGRIGGAVVITRLSAQELSSALTRSKTIVPVRSLIGGAANAMNLMIDALVPTESDSR